MKLRNPNPATPGQAVVAAKKAAVQAFIAAQTGDTIDFDAIRASFTAPERAALTDGVLSQVCAELGYRVEP